MVSFFSRASFHFRSIMAYNQAGEMRVNYYSSPTAYNKNIATGTLRCKITWAQIQRLSSTGRTTPGGWRRCVLLWPTLGTSPSAAQAASFLQASCLRQAVTLQQAVRLQGQVLPSLELFNQLPRKVQAVGGRGLFFHQRRLISTLRDLNKLCPAWVHLCSHASISSRCKLSCNICTNSNSNSNSLTSTPSANNLTTTIYSNRFYLFS